MEMMPYLSESEIQKAIEHLPIEAQVNLVVWVLKRSEQWNTTGPEGNFLLQPVGGEKQIASLDEALSQLQRAVIQMKERFSQKDDREQ